MLYIKLLIFYISHLIWPYILMGLFYYYSGYKLPKIYYFFLVLGLVLAYARFIEPRLLLVKTTTVQINKPLMKDIKIVVFSDTHFGIFQNTLSSEVLARRVNKINPDLILIPGDFLNELDPKDINLVLKGFQKLKAPAYAVTGNHDEGVPGPDYGDLLIKGLESNGIKVLNNSSADFSDKFVIWGLSDLWAGHQDESIFKDLTNEKINILLSHNPDMAYKIKANSNIDLIVSGHTHGGQIRIPFLYKVMIPSDYGFDRGLYFNQNTYTVFVTSGTGMVGLPFRFLVPPQIDVLKIESRKH